jgi:hypothetical protein
LQTPLWHRTHKAPEPQALEKQRKDLTVAEFTQVERQLLKRVGDDRLHTSLSMIRQAAEDIWAVETPRIVQDFTDHGIAHSERLAGFVAKLLNANTGQRLSTHEMYLLLAGVYLHDVGMQCDVVRFPDIKTGAETLGAQFDVAFTAPTASSYSVDEQKAIRKNHHFLTAAWIDHANHSGETVLGPAARTIPEELVDDLMDACKYHAKLSIDDCKHSFKLDPSQRKQVVAALLRFADELDVDGHRVSIETVKNFRLDAHNSVYWWLHNRTKVVFNARNAITLTIRLHPDDVRRHGALVQAAFIAEFQRKNQPVLSVLARNSIPIVISAYSQVVEYRRADPLPPEIVQALQAMQGAPTTPAPQPSPVISEPAHVPQAKPATRHNVPVIHQLLNAAFDDEELTSLCFYHFRDVYEAFSGGMSKPQKIRRLIEHCERHVLLDELLLRVSEANPAQYGIFAAQLRA